MPDNSFVTTIRTYDRFRDKTGFSTPEAPEGFDGVWVVIRTDVDGKGVPNAVPMLVCLLSVEVWAKGTLDFNFKGRGLDLLADGVHVKLILDKKTDTAGRFAIMEKDAFCALALAKNIDGRIEGFRELEPDRRSGMRRPEAKEFKLTPAQISLIEDLYLTIFDPQKIGRSKGKCEACGKEQCCLTPIDSGQLVCLNCLRAIRPPAPTKTATQDTMNYLRRMGFNPPPELPREEGHRLKMLLALRATGHPGLPDNTPLAELERIKDDDKKEAEASLPHVRHFYTKVVGVTHDNGDGSSRQSIIARCTRFQGLVLEHQENNPYDANAIKVCTREGEQIGFLSMELAKDICWKMGHGFRTAAMVAGITGGTAEHPTKGMNILVIVGRPGVSDTEAQEYVDSITPQVLADCSGKRPDDDDEDGFDEVT
jgi:hypothetical protein